MVSGVDEDAVAAGLTNPTPAGLVTALAEAKAHAVVAQVAAEHRDAVVIGCDSMLDINGEMVGKPADPEIARRRWLGMSGGRGELMTGHAVLRVTDGAVVDSAGACHATTIHFGEITEEELTAYVATGEPLAVAGAFTLDGLGGWFVDGVTGDPSSVIGISLPLTRRLLAGIGVRVTDFWATPQR